MMGIRWGNGIPSALRGTTAVYANGYAVRCVKPAVFPRRCSITLRHLPSDFSISITGAFEAAYFLGHHQKIDQSNRDGFGGKGEVLTEVKGVGNIACATILSMLPELGRFPHKVLASLVGVAPPSAQSGEKEGKRGCIGGRMAVRNVLYMAALTATRHEPKIKAFYEG